MDGQCLANCLIYEATICNDNGGDKLKYIGQAEGEFKTRFNNHKKTELANKFWEIKNNGGLPIIKWRILKKVKKYENGQKHCNLCLIEKLSIIKFRDKNLLNSRSEISAKCRHKREFYWENHKLFWLYFC